MPGEKFDSSQIEKMQEEIQFLKDLLFGDGEDKKGVIGRLNQIEDRLSLFWGALGVFGSIIVVVTTNLISSYFKH